jgi:hypothetical protein
VRHRQRVEQQAGLGDPNGWSAAVNDLDHALANHVELAGIAIARQVVDSTQCPRVENAGGEGEVIQQDCQTIGHLDTPNQIIETNYIQKYCAEA